ncbi:MAG: hypothetical protein ACF8R9_09455 [Phycisphaerales bacterium JB054]
MSTPEPSRPRAGIAFIDAVAGDPAAEAALDRAREALRRFSATAGFANYSCEVVAEVVRVLTTALGEAEAEKAEALRLMADLIRGALDDANAQLRERGFDPPGRDLAAWERLARIVEREPSSMTLAEIFDWAIAWSDREQLRARIAASNARVVKTGGPRLQKEALAVALLVQHPEWTNSQIAEAVGCARTSLNRWPRFVLARAALRSDRAGLPRGCKDEGDLEAWDDED